MPDSQIEANRKWRADTTRWLRWVTRSLIGLSFAGVAMLVAFVLIGQHQIGELRQAKIAVCTFKQDLARRVQLGERYLRDHPEGFAGIPVSTLRLSVSNQRRTVQSLSGLECDG